MCVRTSGGWTLPIGGVFGLEEDKESINMLISLMRKHCIDHGVDAGYFEAQTHLHLDQDAHRKENWQNWTKEHLRTFQYPPEWDHFMFQLEHEKASSDALLQYVPTSLHMKPTLHCDSGPAFLGLSRSMSVHFLLQQ